MNLKKYDASIVMVNYFSNQLINKFEKQLDSIADHRLELIVVDNSQNFQAQEPNTKVVAHKKNLGFGQACNSGAASAKSDLLVFLNPDALISNIDVMELVALQERKKPNSIWAPATLDSTGQIPTLTKPGRCGLEYSRSFVDSACSDTVDVTYVSGACLVIFKQFFESLGGFTEDIFLYAEDLDLCVRANRLGADISMHTSLHVNHSGGESSTRLKPKLLRIFRSIKGHQVFFKKEGLGGLKSTVNAIHLASGIRF